MSGSRPRLGVVGLVALGCLACSSATSAQSVPIFSPRAVEAGAAFRLGTWSVVALGDSVPRGTNCDCTPYPILTADGLAKRISETVKRTNDSVAGATTSSVLRQLGRRRVIAHLRTADVVEIEIGANDVAYSGLCGTRVACYAPRIPTIRTNLAAIVARVHKLAANRHVLVVLLDYWSVWLGGQYAAAKGDAYVAAAAKMTDTVNDVIKSTAAESGSAYVDLRAAFKGPSYSYDETHYLSNDGDHPNEAGHQKIARATQAVIEKTLHI
jgi:acyl-CoA thioesterase I